MGLKHFAQTHAKNNKAANSLVILLVFENEI